MAAEIECVVDLGPEQAADIGTVRVNPAFVQFPADRGAADVVVLFYDEGA